MEEKNQAIQPPIASDTKPLIRQMPAGKYFWCSCGRTSKETYCDGSHHKTGLRPKRVFLETAQEVAWCMCKQTQTPPFCDGSHSSLSD